MTIKDCMSTKFDLLRVKRDNEVFQHLAELRVTHRHLDSFPLNLKQQPYLGLPMDFPVRRLPTHKIKDTKIYV